MSGNRVAERRARSRTRGLTLAAAGLVAAAGLAIPSLAAWTDNEWVVGGAGADAGVTSQTFQVQQNTANNAAGVFADFSTAPNANVIDFSSVAAALAPGTTVYGWVQLRTVTGSLGGTLNLKAHTVVPAPPAAETLASKLLYGARVVASTSACAQAAYDASTDILAANGSALDADGTTALSLAASDGVNPGAAKVVCFRITLPAGDYDGATFGGQTVSPLWEFQATTVSP